VSLAIHVASVTNILTYSMIATTQLQSRPLASARHVSTTDPIQSPVKTKEKLLQSNQPPGVETKIHSEFLFS